MVRVENADYLDGTGVPYLVFEYLDGKDVSDLVKDRALGPADALRLGIDVATGLEFLHDHGVYHCDIKPSNLLWTDRGCKIIDFNVAVLGSSSLSKAGGSAKYAPPDLSRGAPPTAGDLADRDVYALGVTLYEVLTGRYPFPSGAPVLGETAADPRAVPRAARPVGRPGGTSAPGHRAAAQRPVRQRRGVPGCATRDRRGAPQVGARPPAVAPRQSRQPRTSTRSSPTCSPCTASRQSATRAPAGEDVYGTYVPTALDEHLLPDVLNGRYRLVIITGNAGDGKTAFLERLVAAAVDRGGQRGRARANGTDLAAARRPLAPHEQRRQPGRGRPRQRRRAGEFFAPFADGAEAMETSDQADRHQRGPAHRLPGRARRRVRHAGPGRRGGPGGEETAEDIAVVNLNQRPAARRKRRVTDLDRVLEQLTRAAFWSACDGCDLAQHLLRAAQRPDLRASRAPGQR